MTMSFSTAHIGPKLATLLFDSHDCRFQSLNQQLFPHCDTLFVCANGFTDLDRLDLPLNVVLLHYGFQVANSLVEDTVLVLTK